MNNARALSCRQCGKPFEWVTGRGRPPVVCSPECKEERRSQQFRASDDRKVEKAASERANRPRTLKRCKRCDREFAWSPGQVYCGAECSREAKLEGARKRSLAFLARVRASDNQCAVDGCEKPPTHAYGLCGMHYYRRRTRGDVGGAGNERTVGVRNNWRDANGYIIHGESGRLLHRVVMEEMLGRPLEPFENVHHLNGRRDDNRPENLELWVKPQPVGQRASDLVKWVIDHYPDLVFEELAKTHDL